MATIRNIRNLVSYFVNNMKKPIITNFNQLSAPQISNIVEVINSRDGRTKHSR